MNLTFRDKKFAKIVNDYRKLKTQHGDQRAKLITLRLSAMIDAQNLDDLRYVPGSFHELIGDRKGQWSCSLDGAYRLIMTPHESPIPQDENGSYIWVQIMGVEVIEIINYHKEK
jgi:toxin HigB-1